MAKFIYKLSEWIGEWAINRSEVAQIDGIVLIDARKHRVSFQVTIENALRLIKQHDPRRYARVKRYISKIINVITPSGFTGRYNLSTRTVHLEFREMSKLTDEDRVAIYAGVLIDHATRGVLRASQKRRPLIDHSRIEIQIRAAKLYADEHNRFLEKLVEADLLSYPTFKLFRIEFDEKHLPKTSTKKKNFLTMLFSIIWRAATERKIKKK